MKLKSNLISDIKNIFNGKLIQFLIVIILILFLLYLFCPALRIYISSQNINPNFVLGFLTTMTLIVSIWQNSKDRKLTYNLSTLESVRNNGLAIISKLVAVRQKSEVILKTLKSYQEAIKSKQMFKDYNETLSKKDIEDGFQIVAAYADTYFREECDKWNEMLNKLSTMATDNMNVILNYEINLQLILSGTNFRNQTLDKIDEIVINAEKTEKEINQLTQDMRNKIITKINSISNKIKNKL